MFLFDRNKLKIRSEEDENEVKTFVEYHGIKSKDGFKVTVLKELIGENSCLGVLDSKLLYFGNQEESPIEFDEIIEYLNSSKISYKKIEMKKIPEVSIFGVTIKKGSKKTDKDYIVGFIANKDNLNAIERFINKLNIYYFIDKTGLDEEILFEKLVENYEDLDEMRKDFYCQIFNNNFIGQLVISSESESAEKIKEIINKCNS